MKLMPLLNNESEQINKLAYLGALCLFLSAIEYLIPKPLPFMRIGLANLPLMLALDIFTLPSFLILVCIKVFGQALITGTLFSYVFLFSVAGTFCSALLMFILRKIFKKNISFIGIGTAGAMMSCLAQLAMAYFFMFGESVRYIAPVFLGVGLITGVLLGIFANKIRTPLLEREPSGTQAEVTKSSARILFIVGLVIMPLIVFNPGTKFRVIIFLVLWVLAIIFRKNTNPLFTIFGIFTIVLFNLFVLHGRVLFSLGPFYITSGALTAGIHRAVTFQALVMLSKLTVSKDLQLPGKFGNLLSESLKIFSEMMNRKTKTIKELFTFVP